MLSDLPTELGCLGADSVHIWLVLPAEISDPALLAAYHRLMNAEERVRQQRFYFPAGRHEALLTRALVRTTLSKYADIRPESWRFVENEYGAPSIAAEQNGTGLQFNLSHTEGLIACAVTRERHVGVDVECIRRPGETVNIAKDFFSPAEVRALLALPSADQRDRFFDYWTLKEAYIKARGMGLSIPLDQFSFQLESSERISICFDDAISDDPEAWQFASFAPTPDHRLALGVRRGRAPDLTLRLARTVPIVPGIA